MKTKTIYVLAIGSGYDSICGEYDTREAALNGFSEFQLKGDVCEIETVSVSPEYKCLPIRW